MRVLWKLAACIDISIYGSVEEIVKLCKYAGIEALEPNWRYTENKPEKEIIEIADIFKSEGIELYSFHLPFTQEDDISCFYETKRRQAIERLIPVMEQAALLGSKALILHPTTNSFSTAIEGLDRYVSQMEKSLSELLPVAERNDLIISLENMLPGSDGERFGSKIEHFILFKEKFCCENVGFCFDTGHAFIAYGPDGPVKFFEKIKDNISAFHIQDNSGDRDLHIVPGKGLINWKEFLSKLSEMEIKFPLTIEAVPFAPAHLFKYPDEAWKNMFDDLRNIVHRTLNFDAD